jgi:hypothetical protein
MRCSGETTSTTAASSAARVVSSTSSRSVGTEVMPRPPLTLGVSSGMLPSSPLSPTRRSTWAQLLHRADDVDALKCPGCGGKLRIIA